MYRLSLISLTMIVMAALSAANVNAQETLHKKITVGTALEFSGGGTSFGIQGKIPIGSNFSVRPIVLFGYQTEVNIRVIRTSESGTSTPTTGGCNSPLCDIYYNAGPK